MQVISAFLQRFNPSRFWNTFFFWRSIRLALCMTIPIIYQHFYPISDDFSRGIFITTLLMSIGDISANYFVRLRLQVIILGLIVLMALVMPYINNNLFLFCLFTAIVIFTSLKIQKVLPRDNMFILISMLCLSFMVTDNHLPTENLNFFYGILIGGAWFILFSFLCFLIYIFLKILYTNATSLFYEKTAHVPNPEKAFFRVRESFEETEPDNRVFLFRHPFRLLLSITIGYLLMQYLESDLDYWIILTIILVHNPSKRISASLPKIFERLGGTFVGLLIMYLIIQFSPPKWLEVLGILTLSFGIFFTIRIDYFIAVIFITLLVVLNLDYNNSFTLGILSERLIDTAIGILIVLGSHSVLLLLENLIEKSQQKKGA